MKGLTLAERVAIAVCAVFVAVTLIIRLRPAEDGSFTIETRAEEVTGEPETGHYINGLLSLNLATADELAGLPGVGEVLAQRIVDYREENGPFASIDELDRVYGIGSGILDDISDYLTLEDTDENSGG